MAANNQDLEKFDQSQTIGCESGDGKAAAEALSALLDRVEKNVDRSSTKVDLPDMTIAGGNDAEAQESQDLSQWENALVQGPTRRTEVTDVSTAPHAGGAGSTKDQLKSIGIQAERTDLLPQGMQEDLKPFLDARDQQQRNQAIRDLQVRVDSGKEATPHAKFALQQARLLDAAIRLEQAEKRRDQLRGTPGFKDADGEITRIVREIVRLEGAQGADATAFLNGHTAHVHKGNAAERTPSKLEGFDTKVKAVRADEARQNELAIDLLAPDPMKRAVRQKPTPADYATALERLQSMAERDDRRAIELLAPIKNQVPALLKDLRNPNPEVAINARNRLETQLVRPKEMGVKVRDLLSDVNPEDLRKAREAEQKAIEGNLNGIAQSVDSFSTVSNGKVADRQQREKAIAEVRQQVSGSNEERLVPVIDWMESTNAKLKIIESANPKAAADEIRKLYEFAQKPLAEDRPNVHAGSALQKICGKENLTNLLQKLESSDPAIAAHALKELKDRLPQKDIVDDLNDHRARALLVQLPKDYKSSDLEVLIKKLEPAANDNEPVKDVLNWAKTEIELKRIQEAQGNPELVSKSVEQLITLADSDNTYARLALAGMLLKDQEAAGWQKHVMSKSSERPLAIDARQSLGTNEASTEATQLRIVRALEQLAQKNPKKVTEAEACAVALAATHAPKGSELRSTAERTLQQHVRENNAVHAGVFEAIKLKEGRDDQHILSRLFLAGCTLDRAKILIVEDQSDQAESVKAWLEREHHQVEVAVDGNEALFMLTTYQYDMVLLDWELPGQSGVEVLRAYRNQGGKAHIIMLTGKADIDSKEQGLDRGADDYLTKPFEPRELSSRIRALQRRPSLTCDNSLKSGDICFNISQGKVTKGAELVQLMPQEYALLEFLMRHPNQVFSADALLNHVWKSDSDATGIAVRTSIMRLRKKLQTEGKPPIISTVHGIGYRFEGNNESC